MQLGRQRPRLEHVPPAADREAAQDCIDLAAAAGLVLDEWQRHVIEGALGRTAGKWQAFEVGLIVPRQNGKGAIIEALELYWLFMEDADRLILHSAHEFKTAREGFLRIRGLIEATPDLNDEVKQFYSSTGGECGVELRNGKRLRFVARSAGAGRGFSPDKLILDEAYNLPETAIDATLPSVGARPNPQVWYVSSAGDYRIAPCDVLARVRRRGIRGDDDSLAFFEWSVDYDDKGHIKGGSPADPKQHAIANPSAGIRKPFERIAKFQKAMSPDGFAREELGVGTWPPDGDYSLAFPAGAWTGCASAERPEGLTPGALALAVSFDLSHSSIGAAARDDDGVVWLQPLEHGPGTGWTITAAKQRQDEFDLDVLVDKRGPAAGLLPALAEAGVRVKLLDTTDVCDAYDLIFQAVRDNTARHPDDDILNAAVASAVPRSVGDRSTWGRKQSSADISMLEAETLAAREASLPALQPVSVWGFMR